jgi:hypothetical protein
MDTVAKCPPYSTITKRNIENIVLCAGPILARIRVLFEQRCWNQVSDLNLVHNKRLCAQLRAGRDGGHHDGALKWTWVRPSRFQFATHTKISRTPSLSLALSGEIHPPWAPRGYARMLNKRHCSIINDPGPSRGRPPAARTIHVEVCCPSWPRRFPRRSTGCRSHDVLFIVCSPRGSFLRGPWKASGLFTTTKSGLFIQHPC